MNTAIQQEQNPMKYIINGRTFDTATSKCVAIKRGFIEPGGHGGQADMETRYEAVLYRTAKGAFFAHEHSTYKPIKGGKPIIEDIVQAVDGADDAIRWIESNGAAVMDAEGLVLPPEA